MQYYPAQNPYVTNPYIQQAIVPPAMQQMQQQLANERQQVMTEETLAWFLESHAIEVIDAVSASLGRPMCVRGTCIGG